MRDKAIANKGKYGGISADDYRSGNVRAHVTHARSHSDDASRRSSAFPESRDASSDRGNGGGYAAPAAPAPAPVPASAEMQPSFANFDDADDGDFEDDTASRRPGGFVPKIQMSAPTSPAPAGPTAALAPPPGADGPARGNLFAAPVVTPAMGGGSTMDDLFGGMTTAAAASTATDPFGDFAAAATSKATTPAVAAAAVPDLFGLDDPAPAPAPAVRNGTIGGGGMGSGMGAMSGLTGGDGRLPAGGAGRVGGAMGGYQQQPMGGAMGGYQQRPMGGAMGGAPQMMGGMAPMMGGAPQMMGGMAPMMGGMSPMPTMSQIGSGMNGAARAPADPFAHSLSQPASTVSSPAPKGHKRVSSTGNDALNGLTADLFSMGVGASGAKSNGGPMNGGAMNAGNRGTPMRPNSGSLI